ncbi:hypothetical protein BJ138DRAFT_666899 [Hygrophoropsis aurantiaca]|uniref:Uncharacterized protein n=1 Tax=Hygrophoropsis aurantiaca TaxID=72124 RepID=A0ACB7ZZB9_9AGAM|nr:hypothetical protein BJ138DRAFT_666899 [Hygrophoropsis aurantiaca]
MERSNGVLYRPLACAPTTRYATIQPGRVSGIQGAWKREFQRHPRIENTHTRISARILCEWYARANSISVPTNHSLGMFSMLSPLGNVYPSAEQSSTFSLAYSTSAFPCSSSTGHGMHTSTMSWCTTVPRRSLCMSHGCNNPQCVRDTHDPSWAGWCCVHRWAGSSAVSGEDLVFISLCTFPALV